VYNETEFPNLHLFFTLPNTFRYAVTQKKNGVFANLYFGRKVFYPEAGKPQLLKPITNKKCVLVALFYGATTYSKQISKEFQRHFFVVRIWP